MSGVALQIWTAPYPSITNDLTMNVYAQSDPLAVIATLTHDGPDHTVQETWPFGGLPQEDLLFRLFETTGGTVIRQLGEDMNVVPGSKTGIAYRAPEQITADVTTGFSSGVSSVVFDGTGGKEDWRGFDIGTLNRMGGVGDMKKNVDYSWNINTGQLQLLNAGDLFNPSEWFNVDFVMQLSTVTTSSSTGQPAFATPKVIAANYNILTGDFGGLLILRPPASGTPSANYITATLPAIDSVVPSVILKIEFARSTVQQCASIACQAGETIDWLQGGLGNIYIRNLEFIEIYKFIDTAGPVWRVANAEGNFKKVGEQVVDDNNPANVFNKILMDGGVSATGGSVGLDVLQYAGLYNQFVLRLPAGEVCNYDAWSTGANQYMYSLANSSDPTKAGKFFIPNRLNQFERITDGTRVPGNWQAPAILQHAHNNGIADDKPPGDPGNVNVYSTVTTDMPGNSRGQLNNGGGPVAYQGTTSNTGGSENRPANIAVRKFLYV